MRRHKGPHFEEKINLGKAGPISGAVYTALRSEFDVTKEKLTKLEFLAEDHEIVKTVEEASKNPEYSKIVNLLVDVFNSCDEFLNLRKDNKAPPVEKQELLEGKLNKLVNTNHDIAMQHVDTRFEDYKEVDKTVDECVSIAKLVTSNKAITIDAIVKEANKSADTGRGNLIY